MGERVHIGDQDGAGVGTSSAGGWLLHLRFDDDRHVPGDPGADPLEAGEGPEVDGKGVRRTRPLEPLTAFDGLSWAGSWGLELYDRNVNQINGTLKSWAVHFTLVPCLPSYKWTLLHESPGNRSLTQAVHQKLGNYTGTHGQESPFVVTPPARFAHSALVVEPYMYIFGGRSPGLPPLEDLWRLDTRSWVWEVGLIFVLFVEVS